MSIKNPPEAGFNKIGRGHANILEPTQFSVKRTYWIHWKKLSLDQDELKKQLANETLTKDNLQALAKWVIEIEPYGLDHVQTAYWNDHPLEAEWNGFRLASFSLRGRVIYRVENKRLIVMVVRVTITHNYRK